MRHKSRNSDLMVYKAEISNGWVLFRRHRIIEYFETETELLNYWAKNGEHIEGRTYELQNKIPPLPEIGGIYFKHRQLESLLNNSFRIEKEDDKYLLFSSGNIIVSSFNSENDVESWITEFQNWQQKKLQKKENRKKFKKELKNKTQSKAEATPLTTPQSKFGIKKKKESANSGNSKLGDNNLLNNDPDWFREQT